MAVARPILGLVSLILIAGAALLMLLTLLGGGIDHRPLRSVYLLQADTSGIPGAQDVSRWTFWNICGVTNGQNACGKVHPAFTLDPPRNFAGPDDNIPSGFLGTRQYYWMTRFMFAFMIIALFFTAVSLLLGLLALCSKIVSYLDGALVSVALFFQTLTAALMTAAFVKGRNVFRADGRDASLGKYAFGFMWASVACLFLATVFLCGGGAASSRGGGSKNSGGGGKFGFGRKKSTRRDRGSFFNDRSSFEKSERPLPLVNGA